MASPFQAKPEPTSVTKSQHSPTHDTALDSTINRTSHRSAVYFTSQAKYQDWHSTVKMAERFIPEHRRTQFKAKNTFKPDELRRRREEQQVEIRKAKREENLAKRRGITGRDGTQMSAPGASLGASVDSDDEGGTIESQVRKFDVFHAAYLAPFIASRVAQLFKTPL